MIFLENQLRFTSLPVHIYKILCPLLIPLTTTVTTFNYNYKYSSQLLSKFTFLKKWILILGFPYKSSFVIFAFNSKTFARAHESTQEMGDGKFCLKSMNLLNSSTLELAMNWTVLRFRSQVEQVPDSDLLSESTSFSKLWTKYLETLSLICRIYLYFGGNDKVRFS